MITPVIMCGGEGTRLWPLSSRNNPKPFLRINNQSHNLLQNTALRVRNNKVFTNPIVICNLEHYSKVKFSFKEINIKPLTIIVEPTVKNTAATIASAAHFANQNQLHNPLLVLPIDHLIEEEKILITTVKNNAYLAHKHIIAFGIKPTFPATMYGYIERGDCLDSKAYKIERFIEKPEYNTAMTLFLKNKCFWNSGIFMLTAKMYLEELQIFEPELMGNVALSYKHAKTKTNVIYLNNEYFIKCKNISMDYAIMERTLRAVFVHLKVNWIDIGEWGAMCQISNRDYLGNTTQGQVYLNKSYNCYIHSDEDIKTIVAGMTNTIVVSTKDTVLVLDKKHARQSPALLKELQQKALRENL